MNTKKISVAICCLITLLLTACGDETTDTVSSQADTNDLMESAKMQNVDARNRSYAGPEIAGIYIGMSPEEVEASMKAYDETIIIQKQSNTFKYSALGKRYQTDPFLVIMVGTVPGNSTSLDVGFSYPPNPPRVISVSRSHRQFVEPLSQADYTASLIEKYGDPSLDEVNFEGGSRAQRTLEWPLEGGTIQCLPKGVGPSAGNSIINRIVQNGYSRDNPSFELSQSCASIMRYTLRGEPVTSASGFMFNVAAAAKAEFESNDWLQGLIEEKSRTGTEKPKL